ncbi:MAG: cytochrome c-type biogenesis protein CcmH [Polyangiaceae bacterium]|nr:cytochrome c-type biogenesis protein CcmH [Polyangiaceae bacterium]
MTRFRKIVYAAAFLFAGATTLVGATTLGQEVGQGMVRTGTVGIENDTERKLFWSLICTCGCPRETLGTCTCGWAHDRRGELRQMLKEGMSVEQVQKAYADRFGSQALAVPPSSGASRLLYLVPLALIAVGAAFVITLLKNWSRKGQIPQPTNPQEPGPNTKPSRDDYDDKLDDELRRLDNE